MSYRYHAPVDPSCPQVESYTTALYEDPMSEYAPIDEIYAAFERRHAKKCQRCQRYGAENVEVVGP